MFTWEQRDALEDKGMKEAEVIQALKDLRNVLSYTLKYHQCNLKSKYAQMSYTEYNS